MANKTQLGPWATAGAVAALIFAGVAYDKIETKAPGTIDASIQQTANLGHDVGNGALAATGVAVDVATGAAGQIGNAAGQIAPGSTGAITPRPSATTLPATKK